MSVAFNTTLGSLAQVGLSAGDIVALSGAGRTVGTWIKSKYLDQALLDTVDKEEIIPRKGLIFEPELQRRWSQELQLLQDGRILPLKRQDVENILRKHTLDSFTWIFTLFTAVLQASCSQACSHWVIIELLRAQCQQSEDKEYLLREAQRNIEAWTSIAKTRKITSAASDRWARMVHEEHEPGLVPDAERRQLLHCLLWLIGAGPDNGQSRVFRTPSSDTVAFVKLLDYLGIKSLCFGGVPTEQPEDSLLVVRDDTMTGSSLLSCFEPPSKRRGMRINLLQPEEAISLWPGTASQNNDRRNVFLSAYTSVQDIQVYAAEHISRKLQSPRRYSALVAFEYSPCGRLSQAATTISQLLWAPSQSTTNVLEDLLQRWHCDSFALNGLLSSTDVLKPELRTQLHVFLLGYYYGLLTKLLDRSRLTMQEAFGSWTWNDSDFIPLIKKCSDWVQIDPKLASGNEIKMVPRSEVLKVMGYIFAGAELVQLQAVTTDCCGIHGKLVLMDRTLLGDADDTRKLYQFSLLDIDGTSLPSTVKGLMICGVQEPGQLESLPERSLQSFSALSYSRETEDFTSTIEPQWDRDLNSSMVTFRRRGRIVHQVEPQVIYHSILNASRVCECSNLSTASQLPQVPVVRHAVPLPTNAPSHHLQCADLMVQDLSLDHFDSGRIPYFKAFAARQGRQICVAGAQGLSKARCCITSLYLESSYTRLAYGGVQDELVDYEAVKQSHQDFRPVVSDLPDDALAFEFNFCRYIVK